MSNNSLTIQIYNLKCAIQEIKNGGRKETSVQFSFLVYSQDSIRLSLSDFRTYLSSLKETELHLSPNPNPCSRQPRIYSLSLQICIWYSVTGFFRLAQWFQVSSGLQHVVILHSFRWLNIFHLTIFYLSVHQLIFVLFSTFCLL